VGFLERATAAPDTAGRRWYNLGLAYQQLQRDTEAVSALGEAIRTAPANPDYHYALAFLFYRLGDLTATEEQTRERLRRWPDDSPGRQLWQRLQRYSPAP
jgi:cytochrome c-type biogenesis protein CcmH/NrfG